MSEDLDRAASETPAIEARTIAIHALPRELARDLGAILRSDGALGPRVRGFVPLVSREKILFATGLVCLVGLVAFIQLGRPCEPRDTWDFAPLFIGLSAPVALLAARAIERRLAASRCPLPPGVFVLSRDLAVVEGDQLFVAPLASIAGTSGPSAAGARDPEVSLWLEGVPALSFRISAKGASDAAALLDAAIESARKGETGKDSLAELKRSSLWEKAPRAGLRAGYARSVLVSLPIALALGVTLFLARNALSDALALAAAGTDSNALRCYAEHGGSNAREVWAHALPDAAYAEALHVDTPDALTSFVASYPDAAQVPEARAHLYDLAYQDAQASSWSLLAFIERYPDAPQIPAVRAALPAMSLAEAVRTDDVGAYTYVIHQYPGTPQALEATTRRHARYESARASATGGGEPAAAAFLASLFAYLEAHEGPDVFVRFRTPDSEMLAAFDDAVRAQNDVPVERIAPSFSYRLNLQRETLVFDRLIAAFQHIAPSDVLALARGRGLPAALGEVELAETLLELPEEQRAAEEARLRAAADDDSGAPEIRVLYDVLPTFAVFDLVERRDPFPDVFGDRRAPSPPRHFAGFVVHFDVELRVPGEPTRRHFELDVEPPPSFSVDGGEEAPTASTIYELMATRAFDQLGERLVSGFFAPTTDAAPL
jgi:hypothetical protein